MVQIERLQIQCDACMHDASQLSPFSSFLGLDIDHGVESSDQGDHIHVGVLEGICIYSLSLPLFRTLTAITLLLLLSLFHACQ